MTQPAVGQVGGVYNATWAANRRVDIYRCAINLTRRYGTTREQRRALRHIAESLKPPAVGAISGLHLHVLPLLVVIALGGDEQEAVPVAALLALLLKASGIIDDLADGDTFEFWQHSAPAEANIGGIELLSIVPHLCIAELTAPAPTRAAMHHAVADMLLRAFAGQRQDLALRTTEHVSAAAVEACAARKAGELVALVSSLPAIYAQAETGVVRAYAKFGRLLGTAQSIAEDVVDLFGNEASSDLRNGTRSFPIASYMQSLDGSDRESFVQLLAEAQGDSSTRAAVRERLAHAGEIQRCALVVAEYCLAAERVLGRLRLPAPVRCAMSEIVHGVPLIRRSQARAGAAQLQA